MAIIKKDRYFGEGISNYGEGDPHVAFKAHLNDVRVKRVVDCIGINAKCSPSDIVRKFNEIKAAIEAADRQVINDNADFMEEHDITIE